MTEEDSMAFGMLTIQYNAAGLRPRPWTRLQSEWAAELLSTLPSGDVLELCSGPGQIGLLALAEAGRSGRGDPSGSRHLVQVESDGIACRLATRNAGLADLDKRVEVRHGPAERSLRGGERFVLVLADPPWVPTQRVKDYPDDPPSAIDGGSDGLDVVRLLLPVIERHLHERGVVLLQIGGQDQVDGVRCLPKSTGSALCVADSREAPGGENGAVALLVHRRGRTD